MYILNRAYQKVRFTFCAQTESFLVDLASLHILLYDIYINLKILKFKYNYVHMYIHLLYCTVLTPSITSISMTPLLLQAFSSATITCKAKGGPRLIISWYKRNELISSGQIGNTSLSFDILNASVTDNDIYTCGADVDDYQINSTLITVLG